MVSRGRPGRDPESLVLHRLTELVATIETFREDCTAIGDIATVIVASLRSGGKVLAFGNGGSALDAEHLALELVGRYYRERKALPAIALTSSSSALTAIANDYDFERVFVRQVEALGKPGDVAVGISTSGRSRNVLAALHRAREMGLSTVGLTGQEPGEMADVSDVCLRVPSSDTPRIQEAHITALHVVCELVEMELTGE